MFNNKQLFVKCQSLGNDFVLFDWLDKSALKIHGVLQADNWPEYVRAICARNHGVGADGVLLLRKNKKNQIEVLIYNADGSDGGRCLNGVRCVIEYLLSERKANAIVEVNMTGELIRGKRLSDDSIMLSLNDVIYCDSQKISVEEKTFFGYTVNAGNPHFVILQKVDPSWLKQNGQAIESHELFPDRTNVEFVLYNTVHSKELGSQVYDLLIYERGCGLTKACGTGAAAVMRVLHQLEKVKQYEEVFLQMPGGTLESYLDGDNNIIQQAPAKIVYKGELLI